MGLFRRSKEVSPQRMLAEAGVTADEVFPKEVKREKQIRKIKVQRQKVSEKERKLFAKRRLSEARGLRQGVREFGGASAPVPLRLTQAQEDMKELFGGGEKIWGNVQQPVTIHNDLNPSQRGDRETGRMFGF